MKTKFEKRLGKVLLVAGILTAALALPATATPADADGHQVTICHVTNSATNPYVVITVDVAAFDGEGRNDHTHHVAKDGRTDVLRDGDCDGGGGPSD